jgi:competence protein ComEA
LNALDAVGGFTAEADQENLNLASRLNDGDRVKVPSLAEMATKAAMAPTTVANAKSTTAVPTLVFPLDINQATQDDLDQLPNIGPTKAAAIIEYRTKNGPFKKLEDIQNVPGIGPSTFEKMKAMITVGH